MSDESKQAANNNQISPLPERDSESLIDRLLGKIGLRSGALIRGELEDALEEGDNDGGFSPEEREMLRNVLRLRIQRVHDVMVPRADIVAVDIDTTLGEMLRLFRTEGHSRLPVYSDTLDDPRGMVHIRDFLDYLAARAEAASGQDTASSSPDLGRIDLTITLAEARIFRPVLFVPPSMPALDLLVKMQTTRTHMALVIDEYGGTDGLVSIEDLVEIVVGDIEDEHDDAATQMITAEEDGSFIADGRTSLEDVEEMLSLDFDSVDIAEDVDTVGGLIATLAGRLPVRGEVIAGPLGLEFQVLDADPRRIKKARIQRVSTDNAEPVDLKKADKPE
ncbi:MAG: HlyC/CorC family transporter [Beijerinckiaceae bacterium]|nr:HlyC/CorC family transporter [Beijerinckiaceae bacterium]